MPNDTDLKRIGRTRLTLLALGRHAVGLGVGGVFFLLGSLFAIAPWGMLARDSRIEREGVRTVATISDREIQEDSDGDNEYVLRYTFVLANNAPSEDQATVGRRAFEAVEVGDSLTIVYDAANPGDSFPIDNGRELDGGLRSLGVAAVFSAFGALFAGFGGLFLWELLVRLPSRWVRLLRDGRTATGTIARIEVDGENASQARLHYTFEDRFGSRHAADTEWAPRRLVEGWAEGDRGQVRYGPRDASESIWLGAGDLTFYR